MTGKIKLFFLLVCFLSGLIAPGHSGDFDKYISLNGPWRFEIGDSLQFAESGYNDSHWNTIETPGNWEDLGYPGYDGYAWYRQSVYIAEDFKNYRFSLVLGRIADADETYFNGKLLDKTGSMPPHFKSAAAQIRHYLIPTNWIRTDAPNIIAIRVFDENGSGGIISDKVGIFARAAYFPIFLDLSGEWLFQPEDNIGKTNAQWNKDWQKIQVPARWELYDYKSESGYAWYQKSFTLPKDKENEHLVLVLGIIPGINDVFINGIRIGGTIPLNFDKSEYNAKDQNWEARLYTIPSSLLKKDTQNVISVRIYDPSPNGGILWGPVGLMTRGTYMTTVDKKE